MAENKVKMKNPDGSVINVAEQFVDVFKGCGYTLVKKEKIAPRNKKTGSKNLKTADQK